MSEALRRIITPPAPGVVDPYTAGMTGAFPRFFAYAPPPVRIDEPTDMEEGDPFLNEQPNLNRPFYEEGDSHSNPAPSIPSPDQSFGGIMSSVRNAGIATGPIGFALGLGALGLSSYRGMEPTTNLSKALSGLFSREPDTKDLTTSGLANAPEGTGAQVSEDGLSPAGPEGKSGESMGGMKGDDGLSTDPGKGEPGTAPDGGEKGDPGPSADPYKEGGLVALAGGGKIAVGPGGGLDDLIPTSIDGRRAAALSDGEFVIPADVVSMMGDGSTNAGSRRLYDLVRQVRDTKTGTTRQAGPLPVGDILKRSLGQ